MNLSRNSSVGCTNGILPGACIGKVVQLKGVDGIFGIKRYQYRNDMICQWQIDVDAGKVGCV